MTPSADALHAIIVLNKRITKLENGIRDALESLDGREPHARMVLQQALQKGAVPLVSQE